MAQPQKFRHCGESATLQGRNMWQGRHTRVASPPHLLHSRNIAFCNSAFCNTLAFCTFLCFALAQLSCCMCAAQVARAIILFYMLATLML